MREILFRGKVADEPNEWVYGYLSDANTIHKIFDNGKTCGIGYFTIIPETVGQYTGLQDMNGTKIFEGDIVQFEDAVADFEGYHDDVFLNRGLVCFSDGGYYITNRQTVKMSDLGYKGKMDCEVISNIHDNPELMEVRRREK